MGVFAVPHWKVFVFGGNSGNLAEGGNPQVRTFGLLLLGGSLSTNTSRLPMPSTKRTILFDFPYFTIELMGLV